MRNCSECPYKHACNNRIDGKCLIEDLFTRSFE